MVTKSLTKGLPIKIFVDHGSTLKGSNDDYLSRLACNAPQGSRQDHLWTGQPTTCLIGHVFVAKDPMASNLECIEPPSRPHYHIDRARRQQPE
ncbi:hypothetical protein CR513_38854, partial [Mucuna pruriens]